jgi:hypothetical protein
MKTKLYVALTLAITVTYTCFSQTIVKNMSSANSDVYSVYKSGGSYYLGGAFTYVGLNTGYAALTTATNDYPNMNFPTINGTVYTTIPDGSGGWYVGGAFSSVGGISETNLVHIKSGNTVDAGFTANCTGGNVNALLLVGSRLYIGGGFTSVNGSTRNRAAAVNSKTGSLVSAWNPDIANGSVNTITGVFGTDTTLWLGGSFTLANTNVSRTYLVNVNSTNGKLINGTTNANSTVNKLVTKKDSIFVGGDFTELGLKTDYLSSIAEGGTQTDQSMPPTNGNINTIIPDGSGGWYVGGNFTTIGGQSRSYVARLNPDKSVNATFNVAGLNSNVYALALDAGANTLYLGGSFSAFGSTTRYYIASVNKNNGTLLNWNPSASSYVYSLSLTANDVLAGGLFTTIGGKYAYRFAAISKSTAQPESGYVGYNSTVNSVAVKNDSILTGGNYSLSAYYNPYAVKITTSSTVPDVNFNANNIIKTVVQDAAGNYYVGGAFTQINGVAQSYVAKLNSSFQVVTGWAPVITGEVRSIALDKVSNTVYIGGTFSSTNGVTRTYISALNTTNGGNKAFGSSFDNYVYTLLWDSANAKLYAGGAFTTVNGSTTRNRLAKFDGSGNLDATWNPSATGGGGTVERLVLSGSNILAGGSFTAIGATTRNYLAKLNNTNGGATNWATANSYVYALYVDGATCYAGGYFTNLIDAGSTVSLRNYIGAITIATGKIATFNPNPDSYVFTITKSGSNLYYGGYFTHVNSTPRNYLAASSTTGTLQSWDPSANSYMAYSSCIYIDPKNNVILGGNFTGLQEVGRSYASVLSYSTGKLMPWTPVINGNVNCITYGVDKIFIGGTFTQVSGSTKNGVAAFNFKGAVQSFDLKLTNSRGGVTVNTIMATTTKIYVGGDFSQALSTNRNDFAEATISPVALSATDASPDRNVYAIAINGSNIAYGGAFTYSNIKFRQYLALINGSSGAALPWNPLPDSYVWDIAYNYNKLFVAGQFSSVNSASHVGAVGFNLNNGSLLSWNPQLNSTGYAIKADSNNVYIGGNFSQSGSTARINAVSVAAANAALNSWNPGPNYNGSGGTVYTIAQNGSNIFLGGTFTFCKGAARNYVAKIDSATGLVNATWNPGTNGYVYSITGNGNTIFIGGSYSQLAGTTRNSLGSVNASTGALTTFDPVVQTGGSAGTVNALAVDPATSILYVGGSFNSVKANTRNNLASLSTSGSGALQSWNPNAGNTVQALAINGSTIYIGGLFTTLNGSTTRNYLGAVNNSNGNVTTFNPNLNSYVYCLTISNGLLYAGGSFTMVNVSTSRSYLAAYDATAGTLKSWNPVANNQVRGIAGATDTIYIGGYFGTLNGSTRNRLGAVRGAAGTVLLPFDPEANNLVWDNFVAGNILLTGGQFTSISGLTRQGFAVYTLPAAAFAKTNSAADYSALTAQQASNSFRVYPNPAVNGTVRLTFDKAITGKVAVAIRSQNGEKVFEQNFESYTNNSVQVNVSRLTNGTYIINLIGNGVNESSKLVIAK